MEILKTKIEPFYDKEQDTLFDIKLVKNETLTGTTGEADWFEERSSHVNLKFDNAKEEKEENCEETEKTVNIFDRVKTEQPCGLSQDDIFSKFNDSSDVDLDSLKYNFVNVKTENVFKDLQQIESKLEIANDMKIDVNTCYGGQFLVYHVLRQEDPFTEVTKSTKPNDVLGKTNISGNNLVYLRVVINHTVL
ncbi:uncharacterized protein LOC143223489 [Tachypleus tridentatus]|uniref:uncharacterized protein LOC143223489 n=1 Tax=Tachypleus tridentatus TaxID=6853 RepID=UPI003FD45E43